jgi:hypothetical protein
MILSKTRRPTTLDITVLIIAAKRGTRRYDEE